MELGRACIVHEKKVKTEKTNRELDFTRRKKRYVGSRATWKLIFQADFQAVRKTMWVGDREVKMGSDGVLVCKFWSLIGHMSVTCWEDSQSDELLQCQKKEKEKKMSFQDHWGRQNIGERGEVNWETYPLGMLRKAYNKKLALKPQTPNISCGNIIIPKTVLKKKLTAKKKERIDKNWKSLAAGSNVCLVHWKDKREKRGGDY